MKQKQAIYALIQEFADAGTLAELNHMLQYVLELYGIHTYSYTYYKHPPQAAQTVYYNTCSTDYQNWNDHFLAEQYNTIDLTLQDSYQSALPQKWLVTEQLKAARSKREQEMRSDSLDYGAIGGFSIPIHGPNHDFAHLVLIAMQRDQFLDKWPGVEFELSATARYYYSATLKNLNTTSKVDSPLTQREMDCLHLLSQKHSTDSIAKRLKIKPRTVHYHIQNTSKKLGATGRYDAITIAKESGLLSV